MNEMKRAKIIKNLVQKENKAKLKSIKTIIIGWNA